MNLLFTGAGVWANSGYSKPLRYLLPRLHAQGHTLSLACFYGYQGRSTTVMVDSAPVRLFGLARDRWFNDIIQFHAASVEADAVISVQDVWTLEGWGRHSFTWLPWLPVDTWPVCPSVLKAIEGCYAPLSYSQFGRDELLKAGIDNARYVPFGIDLDLHQPMPQSQCRQEVGIQRDGFVAGMVAANSSFPSRKSFPEVLQAWARWLDGGGKGLLYLHTTIVPKRQSGIDFQRLLDVMRLPWTTIDDPDETRKAQAVVMFPSQHKMWCHAYDDSELVRVYNSLDVLLAPSMSEGFGIPILEAQACGVPVVTLNCTSMPELTFGGMCIDPLQWYWHDQGGWRGVCGIDALTEGIEWAYRMSQGKKARQYLAEKARVGARAYSWDTVVAEYWLPLLSEVANG